LSERIIGALAAAFSAWGGDDPRWRKRLASALPVHSPEVVERGIRCALEHWTEDALRELFEREGGRAPERAVVWLADTPPPGAFAALALPLLAGCAVRAKPASADPASPALFFESLREADAGVPLALDADLRAIDEADALVVYGSDATVAELRGRAGNRLFVGYGHKLSAAAVGRAANVADCARRLALDACLWDGRGCLSPAWIFVEGRERAEDLGRALASELERARRELPRGILSQAEEVGLHERRAREALAADQVWLSRGGTDWGVFLGGTAPGTLRNLPVVAVDSIDELAERCAALAPHLSSLGHEGFGDADLRAVAARGGGSRVCPPGSMQLPPLDWAHDGVDALQPTYER
jgi:hypothetical protein